MRIGRNWVFMRGDLFRAREMSGHTILENWSRPRIDYLRALVRRWTGL